MSAFLDGELARPQRLRLERHAGDCPDCRSLLAGLRWTVAALQSMAPGVGDSRALPIAAAVRLRLDESPAP